jgi:flagellar hook assembly protein FlgD
MTTIKQIALTLFLICSFALFMSAQAQTPRMTTVNIVAESDKVQITAQGDVSEMRIEVSDESGEVVFQSGAITGQQLDWKMTDAQGERVPAGTYLVTVTFRNAAGKLRKRVEQVTVDEAEKSSTQDVAAPQAV